MISSARSFFRNLTIILSLATFSLFNNWEAAAADLQIYSDTLAPGWSDWSWDTTRNFANTSPVHNGPDSLAVTFNSPWVGLYLHADSAVDTSGYDQLRFWINGGITGNQKLRVVANGDGGNDYTVAAPTNSWTQISVPLTALGNPSSLTDLYWQDTTGNAQPTFFLDDITLIARTGPPPPPPPPAAGPTLSIDAGAARHPISNDIYGMNFADEQLATELHLPVRRWGGNSTSRYNWQTSMYNTGSDWYFENIPDGSAVADGSASDRFVDQDRRTGTKTLMTVPLIGWTPKSDSSRGHPYACGFKVSIYGTQQYTDNPWDTDCGNGVDPHGSIIAGNNPTDTSTAIDPDFVSGWISHLTGKYGTASKGGVTYYDLDNEPMLWNSTHRDVHPLPTSYDEMRDRTYEYAAAIKAADSSAKTLGPVLWGWTAYWYSAADAAAGEDWWNSRPDRKAHGDIPFVPWYLQQMKSYEQQHGVRILDYLDLHNYPQSGVALTSAGNAATQALRLRSTRSLWDPSYTDESWINDKVRLIPRMREWVSTNYPGTKLAITEYNWGGLESINGALAQADVLGIFGREGLDIGTIWGPPESAQPGAYAFRIYRNYDGAGHVFGDTSVQSSSSDQDKVAVYAAQRGDDNALTAVVINKTGSSQTSTVTLSGFTPQSTAGVYRYSPTNLAAIEHPADQPLTASGFTATFPANSITLYVIPSTVSGNRTLTIDRTGSGSGSVSADPGGIVWNGNTGTAGYPDGTFITLTASPLAGSGSAFNGWSGACSGESNPCTFAISSDTSVNARFDLITDFTAVPTSDPVPIYVCFSDASNNNPSSWLWDLGDGGSADTRNPCHAYISAGNYGVSLTSSGGGGEATRTISNYINASACANKPARISGGSSFTDIQSAYDKSINYDKIEAQALVFDGGFTLGNDASVTLEGGYICDYSTNPMSSTIHGPLTIGGGSLTLDRVVIQ